MNNNIVKEKKYNEILLLKGSRNDPQFKKSFWYTVTGGCEDFDLNREKTVKREVIEETGLKGMKIGGAEVSTKHANFIINKDNATPEDIYNEPQNAFVARFIGESNIIDGVMHEDLLVEFCGRNFECVDKGFKKDEQIQVVIRPEDIKMVDSEKGMLKGEVTSCVFKGVHYEMTVESCGLTWLLHNTKSAEVGSVLGMDIYPEDIHIMKKTGDDE